MVRGPTFEEQAGQCHGKAGKGLAWLQRLDHQWQGAQLHQPPVAGNALRLLHLRQQLDVAKAILQLDKRAEDMQTMQATVSAPSHE